MDWLNIFVTVLLLLLMIGILISTHELGHLLVAKAFKVYCFEYSIGFGPRLFHIKKKGWETDISFRALPLGGYVSMYGEGVDVPTGLVIPESRSLQAIRPWKRILVMLAGIMVNLFTAVLFAFIYATCIPSYVSAQSFDTGIGANGEAISAPSDPSARAYSLRLKGNSGDFVFSEETLRLYAPLRATELPPSDVDYPYVIDAKSTLTRGDLSQPIVTVFSFQTVNGNNDFLANLSFYTPKEGAFLTPLQEKMGLSALPDPTGKVALQDGDRIALSLSLLPVNGNDASPDAASFQKQQTESLSLEVKKNALALSGEGSLLIGTHAKWLPFGERLLNGCYYISSFFGMIGQAFAMIFTGHFEAVGSIVAAGAQMSTLATEIGYARTFFFYGGFLSLNLAIFNLLPFPGLDGYQVLVTAVEKLFHREIPAKVKNAISMAGVLLLLLFSIFIIGRDIMRLF